jgi:8-hydroxy-5-deazaflavin:NADPH oxidoreductase
VCNETTGEQNSMRIGIIGAGKVGGSLGKLWVRAGHEVFFSSRHPNRLKALVEEAGSGAYSGTVADAAFFGEIILFSPNFWGLDDALKAAGPLKGKTVVDVTNPLEWNPNNRMVRSLPWSTTAGEELAKKLPDAQVVKAFSTIPASFIPHAFFRPAQLQRLVVFYCGDHRLSKVAVDRLIADSGFVGVDAGSLRLARELEAPGRLHRAGLVGIVEARRLLKEIADSAQNGLLVSRVSDQPAFAATPSSSFVSLGTTRSIQERGCPAQRSPKIISEEEYEEEPSLNARLVFDSSQLAKRFTRIIEATAPHDATNQHEKAQ